MKVMLPAAGFDTITILGDGYQPLGPDSIKMIVTARKPAGREGERDDCNAV